MDDLGILLGGKFDVAKTIADLNKDLSKIASQVKGLDLKVDTSKIAQQIQQETGKIKTEKLKPVEMDASGIKEDFSVVGKSIKDYEKQFQSSTTSVTKYIDQQSREVKKLAVTMQDAQGVIRKMNLTPQLDAKDNIKYGLDPKSDMQIIDKTNEQRRKALEYEQQTRMAMEKKEQQRKKEIADLNHTIQKERDLMEIRRMSLERKFGRILTPEQKKSMDDIEQGMRNVSATSGDATKQIDNFKTEMKRVEESVNSAKSRVSQFSDNLREAMVRIPVWFIGMTAK